ncbi:MAG: hypothetical protein ABSG74_13210 [Candidatus Bathyarchaeia archaeon]
MEHNEIELGKGKSKVELPKIGDATPTLEDEMSPSPEQLDMSFAVLGRQIEGLPGTRC